MEGILTSDLQARIVFLSVRAGCKLGLSQVCFFLLLFYNSPNFHQSELIISTINADNKITQITNTVSMIIEQQHKRCFACAVAMLLR